MNMQQNLSFAENTNVGRIYFNMLELPVFLQPADVQSEEQTAILFQHDMVPPYFSHEVQHAKHYGILTHVLEVNQ
jgi:hypothetical protein